MSKLERETQQKIGKLILEQSVLEKQIGKLRRFVNEREKLRAENERAKTSKIRKVAIAKRLDLIAANIKEALLVTKIGAKHVTTLVDKMKEAKALVDAEQAENGEMLVRLRARALPCIDDEQEKVDSGGARDHRPHEALVTGNVDD